jgi:hypothetical protein
MKHNDDIEEILYDNCPVDDFLGFTPTELNYLVYDTFGDKSPLQFRNVHIPVIPVHVFR